MRCVLPGLYDDTRAGCRVSGVGLGFAGFGDRDEDYGDEAEEHYADFDIFAAVVKFVEVSGVGVVGGGGVDSATGSDAITLHGWDDDELGDGGKGDHEEDGCHDGEGDARTVDTPGGREGEQSKQDHAGDEANAVENAEQVADDGAGGVGVRLERGEGDGGDHGEEDFGAEPDDEGEIKKSA